MLTRTIFLAFTLLAAPSAMAAADLTTTLTVNTSPALTGATARYTAAVRNIGNKSASNCVVDVALPATHTSPQVYVLGTLGAKSPTCTQTGTRLRCTLGTIARNQTASVFFDIALPVSAAAYTFVATATTTSPENSTANNSAPRTALETYYATPINALPGVPVTMNNRHCTGTALTAFYECTLSPGVLSAHTTVFHSDGSITIPDAPGYTGQWTLTSTSSGNFLAFFYDDGTGVIAEFEGWGADGACFEGLTTFPGGGSDVAPYEVCPQ